MESKLVYSDNILNALVRNYFIFFLISQSTYVVGTQNNLSINHFLAPKIYTQTDG